MLNQNTRVIILVTCLGVGASGCASLSTLSDLLFGSGLPTWCEPEGPLPAGRQIVYLGRSDGALDSSEAFSLAMQDALGQLTQELGVRVESQSVLAQREVNGVFSTDVQLMMSTQSAPVTIRGLKVARRFTLQDKWEEPNPPGKYRGCVQIRIPPKERRRLERVVLGRTVLSVLCEGLPSGDSTCPPEVRSQLEEVLTHYGVKIAPLSMDGAPSDQLMAKAREIDAAFVLVVVLRTRFVEEINGEFFAEASASVRRLDAYDQKTLTTLQVEPQVGGHLNVRDAQLASLDEVLLALRKQLKREGF